jgi:hypothetical protein
MCPIYLPTIYLQDLILCKIGYQGETSCQLSWGYEHPMDDVLVALGSLWTIFLDNLHIHHLDTNNLQVHLINLSNT